jgi:hypothetical protein
VEQDLLTILEHMSPPPVFSGIRVALFYHSLSRVVVPATLHSMLCSVAGTTTLDRECCFMCNAL